MSKAVRFHELGGPEVLKLEEVTVREPAEGEVALDVIAVGLNRAESMYFHGRYNETAQLPSALGYEAVGKVTKVGAGVDPSWVGKQVGTVPGFSQNKYGVLGEKAVVPAHVLAEVPPSLSAVEAAAVWMQYGTAYGALVPFGKVAAGDFVLITAASSSVGLAAIQIVKAQGGRSIATTRTSAKKQELLDLGADFVIATQEEDLVARVQEITAGKLARVVFDPVGGDYMNTLGAATANGGSIFLYGMLSQTPTPFPMTTFARGVAMYGYSIFEMLQPQYYETMKRYIYDRLADGTFKPKVDRVFKLEDIAEAYRYLESNQQVGKIVVTVG